MQTLLKPTGLRRAVAACGLATSLLFTPQAHADDWGCTVLLCLANPGGPMKIAECVGPIKALWKHLAKLNPFPTCVMAEASGSGANQVKDHYDVCPEGTTPLEKDALALPGPSIPPADKYHSDKTGFFIGRGDTKGMERVDVGRSRKIDKRPKVCVGKKIAEVNQFFFLPGPDEYIATTVGIYDQVVTLDWQDSPNVIDVFIEGKLHNRVRW